MSQKSSPKAHKKSKSSLSKIDDGPVKAYGMPVKDDKSSSKSKLVHKRQDSGVPKHKASKSGLNTVTDEIPMDKTIADKTQT